MTDEDLERELPISQAVSNPLPESIRVGCVTYRVVLVSAAVALKDSYLGKMDTDCLVIWIKDSLRPPFAADVLLHEVLHCCYAHFGIAESKEEEYTVNAISACLSSVLSHNPKLMAWLAWAHSPSTTTHDL